MNGELLPKAEYYRLARAAELRRKADRLESLQPVLPWLMTGVLLTVFCGSVMWNDPGIPFVFAVAFALLQLALPKRIASYRREAAALEAEHEARNGAPRPGEG